MKFLDLIGFWVKLEGKKNEFELGMDIGLSGPK